MTRTFSYFWEKAIFTQGDGGQDPNPGKASLIYHMSLHHRQALRDPCSEHLANILKNRIEPVREKTNNLPMRKQRRRSASR